MRNQTGSIDEILITSELDNRPRRARDVTAELRAFTDLAAALAADPRSALQKLTDVIVDLCLAESAGVSIAHGDGPARQFQWPAVSGAWADKTGDCMPIDASPCSVVIARDIPLLFDQPERHFPAALQDPRIREVLLVPFHVDGRPMGTLWAIAHTANRNFDAGDVDLLSGLARLASVAYQLTSAMDNAAEQHRIDEDSLRRSVVAESERRYRAFVTASADAVYRMSPDWSQMRQLNGQGFLADLGHARTGWFDDYLLPQDRARIHAAIARAIRLKDVFELEHAVRRADGSIGWTFSRAVPVLSDQGDIIEWIGTANDRTKRRDAERRLRDSEERYRDLVDSLDEGLCIIEVLFDKRGRAIDYLFLQTNPAFDRQTGLVDAVGKTIRELIPSIEQRWFDIYGEVARTGEAVRVEEESMALGRWYDVYASPIGSPDSHQVAVLFHDIGPRKREETALREAEERQAFLLAFGDAVWRESNTDVVIAVAMRLLGEKLGASRIVFAETDGAGSVAAAREEWSASEVEYRPDIVRIAGLSGPSLDDLRAGRTVRYDDIGTPPHANADLAALAAIGIRAGLSVPLIVAGCLVATLDVHQETVRRWTDVEVGLVQEVAERTWAAVVRVRAETSLFESEERLRQFGENSPDTLWILDLQGDRLEYLSAAYEKMWGNSRAAVMDDAERLRDSIHPDDRRAVAERMRRLQAGGRGVVEYRIIRPDGAQRWIFDTGFPIMDDEGRVTRLAGVSQDVTLRREAEDRMAESERRFRTLSEGVPQLVWRAVDHGHWSWASPQWTEFTGQSDADSRGWGWLEPVHADDRAIARDAWDRSRTSGTFEADVRLRHADDGRYRWFTTRATAVRDERDLLVEWLGTSTDVDDLRRLQGHQQLLLGELQHRVRNSLAVIRSIARRTIANSETLDDLGMHLDGRLASFARTQAAVTRDPSGGLDLGAIVLEELLAHDAREGRRAQIDGPDIRLVAKVGETLGLAFHELATNAVKYGALSVTDGTIRVNWRIDTDAQAIRWLMISWDEARPGASVTIPARRGFGTELLEDTLGYELDAETRLLFRPTGLLCTIKLPLVDGMLCETRRTDH